MFFGKDRANGPINTTAKGVEGPLDMFEVVEQEEGNHSFNIPDPPIVRGEEVDGPINTQSTTHTSNRSSRKRKSVDPLITRVNGLENVMSSHLANANENIQEIALFYRQVAERESTRDKRRKHLASEIRKINGLSIQ